MNNHYKELSDRMISDAAIISDSSRQAEHLKAIERLKADLEVCLSDEKLDSLTKIYRDFPDDAEFGLGFQSTQVVKFLRVFDDFVNQDEKGSEKFGEQKDDISTDKEENEMDDSLDELEEVELEEVTDEKQQENEFWSDRDREMVAVLESLLPNFEPEIKKIATIFQSLGKHHALIVSQSKFAGKLLMRVFMLSEVGKSIRSHKMLLPYPNGEKFDRAENKRPRLCYWVEDPDSKNYGAHLLAREDYSLQDPFEGYQDVSMRDLTEEEIFQCLIIEHFRYEDFHHTKYPEESLRLIATQSQNAEEAINFMDGLGGWSKDGEVTPEKVAEFFDLTYINGNSDAERRKLMTIQQRLEEKVIGQEAAIRDVSRIVKKAGVGFNNPEKPLGTFLFVGPTGVGKTELAKQMASEIYGDEDAFIRFDMSEYSNEFDGKGLIGAGVSFKDSTGTGPLIDLVKENPKRLILFDEIEKAAPQVRDTLLQLLDAGRLTSGGGTTVSYHQCYIVMTSNAGMTRDFGNGVIKDKAEFSVEKFKKMLSPEFLNRFDSVVEFAALSEDDAFKIAGIKIQNLVKLVKARQGLDLSVTEEAQKTISQIGYSAEYGARALEQAIDAHITSVLTDYVIDSEASSETGSIKKITVDVTDVGVFYVMEGEIK